MFLEDVMTRYYDQRQVLIDLVANLYKEQTRSLVPMAIKAVNNKVSNIEPIHRKEIEAYYRKDRVI